MMLRYRLSRALSIALLAVVVGCVSGRGAATLSPRVAPEPSVAEPSESTVRAFVAAYNAHDIPALLALADSNIVWLSVVGDSVQVETRGRDALAASLAAYFRRLPSARSTLEAVSASGPWVTVRERAYWNGAQGARDQAAVAVYEVREGRVRRVWYFPVIR